MASMEDNLNTTLVYPYTFLNILNRWKTSMEDDINRRWPKYVAVIVQSMLGSNYRSSPGKPKSVNSSASADKPSWVWAWHSSAPACFPYFTDSIIWLQNILHCWNKYCVEILMLIIYFCIQISSATMAGNFTQKCLTCGKVFTGE